MYNNNFSSTLFKASAASYCASFSTTRLGKGLVIKAMESGFAAKSLLTSKGALYEASWCVLLKVRRERRLPTLIPWLDDTYIMCRPTMQLDKSLLLPFRPALHSSRAVGGRLTAAMREDGREPKR